MNRIEELEKKPIGRLLLQYSVPTVLSLLINSLYTVIDRIFIGNIPQIGALALTGVGLTTPITTLVVALSALISIGAGNNISIKLGEGKREAAENTAANSIVLTFILGISLTVFYLLLQNNILGLLNISKEILVYSKEYITIIMLGAVLNMLGFLFPFLVRSDGNPKISATITITGCITNILLDILFIFIFNMGIRGAALATVAAQLVTVLMGIYYFIKCKPTLILGRSNFKIDTVLVKDILVIGFVPFSNQLSISIAQMVSNYSLKLYGGELAIGAMTVITSIAALFLMPVYGISQGCQPIIAYNYAKNQYHRAVKTLYLAALWSASILTIGTLIALILPEYTVGLFARDPVLKDIAVNGIGKYMSLLPLATIPTLGIAFMMLSGNSKRAILLNILRQSVILGSIIFMLPKAIGANGLWLAQPITDLTTSLITIALFLKSYGHIFKSQQIPL